MIMRISGQQGFTTLNGKPPGVLISADEGTHFVNATRSDLRIVKVSIGSGA